MASTDRRLLAIMFSDVVGFTAAVARDEADGLRLRDRHVALVQTNATAFGGCVIKTIGDGLLVTFPSSLQAVRAGLAIQQGTSSEAGLSVRIGIHTGDVLLEDGDVAGDGVNVAARLQALARPGQVCTSARVYEDVRNHDGIAGRDLGMQHLKNVGRPMRAYALVAAADGRALRAARSRRVRLAWGALAAVVAATLLVTLHRPTRDAVVVRLLDGGWLPLEPEYDKEIGFTTTSDGVRIAYAVAGSGPAVLIIRGWFTHLQRSPNLWVPELLGHHRVVFFDCRGMGLSDRNIGDYSLEGRLRDVEAVVAAVGLSEFALFGDSSGGPVAIAYAARHPERVRRLLLYGTYAYATPEVRRRWGMLHEVIRVGWGDANPAFRELFAKIFVPDANGVFVTVVSQLAMDATTPHEAGEFVHVAAGIDVRELAKRVEVPTLVVHRAGDQVVPLEESRLMASLIPRARLRVLPGRNHLILPGDDVRRDFVTLMTGFLGAEDSRAS